MPIVWRAVMIGALVVGGISRWDDILVMLGASVPVRWSG